MPDRPLTRRETTLWTAMFATILAVSGSAFIALLPSDVGSACVYALPFAALSGVGLTVLCCTRV